MIDLVVFGTWEYEWMIPPHAALLAKYAPSMRMIYYGDRQTGDLPANVEFRRAPHLEPGQDWDWAEDDWGPYGGFGVGFQACMEDYGQPVALFTFTDFWPVTEVNVETIEQMAEFIQTQPDLMRIQVGFDLSGPNKGIGTVRETWHGIEVATIAATDAHYGNMGGFHWFPSLWNMPLLLDFLIPECSHWGFEASHQLKMESRPDLWSGWPRNPAYVVNHAHDRTEPGANIKRMKPEDRAVAKAALRPGIQYWEGNGWKTKR